MPLFAWMNTKERLLLLTLAAINFTNIMDFMIMMPLGPQLMRIFNINTQQFGLVVSSYTFSAGFSGFCTAFFIDKFDRKRFLQVLYAGFLVGTLLCGLANTYELLMIARIFTGLFGGVLGAVILAIVGDVIPFDRRGQAMGFVMAAFSIASVLGVPFGLRIANQFGWNTPFLVLAFLALPVQFFIFKFVPNLSTHTQAGKQVQVLQVIKNITSSPNQRKAITLMMVVMFGHFSIIPFLSPYMVSNVGFTEGQLEQIYFFGGLSTIITSPLIGKLADRIGKLKVFTIFVSISIIPVLFITNMPRVDIWITLIATSVFFSVSSGRFIPAQAMVTATVEPQNRGSFMSIVSSMQQLSAGLAAYIAGLVVVKQTNGEMLYYNWVGLMSIAAAIVTLFLVRRITAADGSKF
jgi:predicted MFS family arabinose efflux permease